MRSPLCSTARPFDTEGGAIAVKIVTMAKAIKNANVSVGVEVDWVGGMRSLAVGVKLDDGVIGAQRSG